ncbi:MAG: HIT domain-containing protein [bacterium]
MSDCVFCKIVAEEIPSIKIWENDQCIAILDAFPACKAQVVVLPKNHCSSDIFILDDILYTQLMLASKEVVALLKK